MNERSRDDALEPIEGSAIGPGSDPGAAYERAVEHDEAPEPVDRDAEVHTPDAGDVYRSGS